jgi:hypothetical protein
VRLIPLMCLEAVYQKPDISRKYPGNPAPRYLCAGRPESFALVLVKMIILVLKKIETLSFLGEARAMAV